MPASWSDEQAAKALNAADLCGTENGWCMRHSEDANAAYKARVACESDPERVHILFDA